jgi:hypothetical protein
MKRIAELWRATDDGLIFANLVDFDVLYGHRRDLVGYTNALIEFDGWLGTFLESVEEDDLVIITADHGNDPGHAGTDHTREEVPLMVLCGSVPRPLGTRSSFADVAASLKPVFSPQEKSGRSAKHSSTLRRVTHIPSFIERKRDGLELSGEEIAEFVRGFTSGAIPDYQASAWAMAVYFRGMTRAETHHLTRAMMESGRILAHPPVRRQKSTNIRPAALGTKFRSFSHPCWHAMTYGCR